VFTVLLYLSLLILKEGAFGCAAEGGEIEGCLKRSAETRYILRIFFHLSLQDRLKMRLAIVGKTTLLGAKKSAFMNYELLLARERHLLTGDLANCDFMLSQFPFPTV